MALFRLELWEGLLDILGSSCLEIEFLPQSPRLILPRPTIWSPVHHHILGQGWPRRWLLSRNLYRFRSQQLSVRWEPIGNILAKLLDLFNFFWDLLGKPLFQCLWHSINILYSWYWGKKAGERGEGYYLHLRWWIETKAVFAGGNSRQRAGSHESRPDCRRSTSAKAQS